MIQQVEELRAELDVLRFTNWEPLDDRKVYIGLFWPTQNVAPNVADVGSGRTRSGGSV